MHNNKASVNVEGQHSMGRNLKVFYIRILSCNSQKNV